MVTLSSNANGGTRPQALCAGDAEMGRFLVATVRPIARACCRRLGLDGQAAEDVVAETYLSVLRGLPKFAARARFSSWVWTIATRQAVDHLRRRGRAEREQGLDRRPVGAPRAPTQVAQDREQARRLREAVACLPERWAEAIRRYYWQAQSTQEIARTMRVRDGVVRAYLFRGRNRLRRLLSLNAARRPDRVDRVPALSVAG